MAEKSVQERLRALEDRAEAADEAVAFLVAFIADQMSQAQRLSVASAVDVMLDGLLQSAEPFKPGVSAAIRRFRQLALERAQAIDETVGPRGH